MANDLPYFKFVVSEFILGEISDDTDAVVGMFYRACSHYWFKQCNTTKRELVKKIGARRVELLIKKDYIKLDGDVIVIEFLDEQRVELSKNHKVNSENGSKGAKIRWAKKNSEAINSPLANESHLDKDKEVDKIREDKEVYRSFAHLSINTDEISKLLDLGFTQTEIDDTLDAVENYKKNKSYTSLYLTARKWLKEDKKKKTENAGKGSPVKKISAYEQAKQNLGLSA